VGAWPLAVVRLRLACWLNEAPVAGRQPDRLGGVADLAQPASGQGAEIDRTTTSGRVAAGLRCLPPCR
jgi:hypothetical protein